MKKYRALSLITAAVMGAVLTSCEYGYASDRKKKETSSAVSEQKEKAEKVSDKYENIDIEEKAFDGLSECTLFVPVGTEEAYRHDERFKVFKEVKIER